MVTLVTLEPFFRTKSDNLHLRKHPFHLGRNLHTAGVVGSGFCRGVLHFAEEVDFGNLLKIVKKHIQFIGL
jgi:hypothetical protein